MFEEYFLADTIGMYYYMNPRRQVMVLQMIVLVALIVIGAMIYSQYGKSDEIENEIKNLDLTCPQCPKCPDLTNPIHPDDFKTQEPVSNKCPQCPDVKCPEPKCPSVGDIVSGIFPGRNTGITRSGRHFDVKSNKSFDLLPDFSFYKAEDAFPEDSILDPPLRWANMDAPLNDINNSIDNYHVDTNSSSDIRRMSMGSSKRTDPKMSQTKHKPLSELTPPIDGAQHPSLTK